MQRLAPILLLVFNLIAQWNLCNADDSEAPADFRAASWGDSRETVKASEKGPLVKESEKSVFFQTQIVEMKALVEYTFVDNKLTSGGYQFYEERINRSLYRIDYERVKQLLIKKYGDPIEDNEVWFNDMFKYDPEKWGTALVAEHVVMLTTWETERTKITLMIMSQNYDVTFAIGYQSKALAELTSEQDEKETLDQL